MVLPPINHARLKLRSEPERRPGTPGDRHDRRDLRDAMPLPRLPRGLLEPGVTLTKYETGSRSATGILLVFVDMVARRTRRAAEALGSSWMMDAESGSGTAARCRWCSGRSSS
jgi:hypothetical protein